MRTLTIETTVPPRNASSQVCFLFIYSVCFYCSHSCLLFWGHHQKHNIVAAIHVVGLVFLGSVGTSLFLFFGPKYSIFNFVTNPSNAVVMWLLWKLFECLLWVGSVISMSPPHRRRCMEELRYVFVRTSFNSQTFKCNNMHMPSCQHSSSFLFHVVHKWAII